MDQKLINQAYHRRFGYLTDGGSEQYLAFLKDHAYDANPTMWSVLESREVVTEAGKMVKLKLGQDLESPEFDIAAFCMINCQPIIIWKDTVWTVAVTASGSDYQIRCGFDTNGLEIIIYEISDSLESSTEDDERIIE